MSHEDEIPEFKFEPSESILQKLKLIPTNEKLTAAAGLGTLIEIFDQSGLNGCVRPDGEHAHTNSTH